MEQWEKDYREQLDKEIPPNGQLWEHKTGIKFYIGNRDKLIDDLVGLEAYGRERDKKLWNL